MVPLSSLGIIFVLAAIALFTAAGLGFHRMVRHHEKQRAEYRRRVDVKMRSAATKVRLRSILRPLGLKRVSLKAATMPLARKIRHRRQVKIHKDL